MGRHRIGTVEDFPAERGRRVFVEDREIAVFRIDGEFYAIHNVCTHKNLPLHHAGEPRRPNSVIEEGARGVKGRVNAEDCTINCPWHLLEWDLETGYNAATDTSIPTYDVTVEGEEVWLST